MVEEDEEAEEGWTSSADGHDSTRGAKLLTTPPPSTGEQTIIPLKCHHTDSLVNLPTCLQRMHSAEAVTASVNLSGVQGTQASQQPKCFQRGAKTAHSGRDKLLR